jgi:lysyl-tRNA synthetase class 1
MSSSRGNVLSISRALEVVPADALRYFVLREPLMKTISFDPGLPLLRVVDELDEAMALGRDDRAVELSRAGRFRPVGVPSKHLMVVAQVTGFDPLRSAELLRRTGYPRVEADALALRMPYARRWLESFAPEELRFTVQPSLPAGSARLDELQRRFLGRLAERLEPRLDGEELQQRIYEVAGEFPAASRPELFRAIYESLLGRPRGPRAGAFVALVGVEFCAARFREAAGGSA